MDIETKFFSWPLTGEDHVTVIARGRIDVGGVKQIFLNVAEITQMLVGCGVLIDLRQGTDLPITIFIACLTNSSRLCGLSIIESPWCLRRRSSSRINCSYSAFASRSRV